MTSAPSCKLAALGHRCLCGNQSGGLLLQADAHRVKRSLLLVSVCFPGNDLALQLLRPGNKGRCQFPLSRAALDLGPSLLHHPGLALGLPLLALGAKCCLLLMYECRPLCPVFRLAGVFTLPC